ncbi:cytochrome c oxidase assembly protein [Deinococcus peraridilitoris]|uniref:Putative membrane protein n=1 Tax=Deinococcus peraridilitoris (strain DSM 19664 / LMG 22246 / CIP 109416 / KR-200) TaxID=937777 RepID=L0A2A3_DEIPD|nr:cytochrome c oxidase assembly protein [Deinococcus peraridilitoris]AFZ67981.1 putative membrane protein [Deinococcus peraridilitoris DSM 19664]
MDLNPSPAALLFSWRLDPLVWGVTVALVGVYFWHFVRVRRSAEARAHWPGWRALLFGLGALVALLGLQTNASSYTLNSMALYMGRLMLLAELAPPLLMLGLPSGLLALHRSGPARRLLSFVLDPFVVFALWTTIIVFWNLPIGFNASLVSATASTLLPVLYLLGGTLLWAVALNTVPQLNRLSVLGRGAFGFLSALPMMGVAAVWLYSPAVLYSPYVNVPCLWNLTPLQNQQISGLVMLMAGMPALALALMQVLGGLLKLSEAQGELAASESGSAD